MDSVTQVLLGAAVGEVILGKKTGNRAVIWGGVAGLIPDLDPYFPPYQSAIQWITLHRGITHSIIFAIVFGLFMGFLLSKLYKNQPATWKEWSFLCFMGLFTHALLDCLTIFGTQIFLPFSNYRVEIGSVAFRDPVYSIILALTLVVVLFLKKNNRIRWWIGRIGMGLSLMYLAFAGINKISAESEFKKELARMNIENYELKTRAVTYTSYKWYGVADVDSGFYTGTLSVFYKDKKINLQYIQKKEELLAEYKDHRFIKRIEWFTKGYFIVRKNNENLVIADLRFGNPLQNVRDDNSLDNFIFAFEIIPNRENPADIEVRFFGRD